MLIGVWIVCSKQKLATTILYNTANSGYDITENITVLKSV